MASQMHKINLGQPVEEFPNVDQFFCPTNKHPEFVRVIYDPFIMLDAYWTERDLIYIWDFGFLIWVASIEITKFSYIRVLQLLCKHSALLDSSSSEYQYRDEIDNPLLASIFYNVEDALWIKT